MPSSPLAAETDDGTPPPSYDANKDTDDETSTPTIKLEVDDFSPDSSVHVVGSIDDSVPDGTTITVASAVDSQSVEVDGNQFETDVDVSEGPEQKVTASFADSNVGTAADAKVDVLFPPTIEKPEGPIGSGGVIRGKAYSDADVTVSIDGHSYTATASSQGEWSISVDREFSNISATATQTTSWADGNSDKSPAVKITVDLTAPQAPTITSPADGSNVPASGAKISGTGEPGSTVKVFAGSQTLCTVEVSSSRQWSCTAAEIASSGSQKIVAKADDNAGNSSGDGPAITVIFGTSSSPSDPPEKTPSDKPGEENSSPDDGNSTTPKDEKPEPSESDDSDSRDEAVPPPAAPPNGPGPWNHATPFTESLPSAVGAEAIAGWLRALLLALLTVALILIPARMLAGTLARRRVAASGISVTGRNRSAAEFDRAPMLATPSRVAMIVIGIAATGTLTIFANPVDGRPAFLRLLIAAILAAALVNAVAAWVPRILSHVWQCGFTEVQFNPRWLLLVAAAVLASRVFDLHPALLFALVTTVRVPTVLNRTVLARLALTRIGGVFVVGVLAWLLAALVPQGGGFFTQLLIETANITALVGIGSSAIMMVPLGRLSGRAIFAWSRPLWLASVLAILTALFVMLGPSIENWRATGNLLAALALVFAFAALGISVWLWKRYVQPLLANS
ncbi:Ig-like domain-containing protein [Microbacterium sp. MPKO10]|uniref:Ig-like domain-containing protein n=1 Tax=Microbacterium sp. MPKO10 TaxID=2989818 RepID=UPI0022368AB7|nr:Ig-like domain-containing protein [Microbacterium sp. MPKO10]MCW4457938.1 Ig-like domain-containing protein [Microbacterium sp. MPKO10]